MNLHTLPHLKYLYVRDDAFSKHRNNFYFNPYNISHLHSILFNNSYFRIRWSKRDSFLYYLRSLTITVEEPHDTYLKILASCPNLIRLQTEFWPEYEFQMQRNSVPQLNLRRLIINTFKVLSCEMLEFLLSNAPNLTHLAINGLIDVQYDTLATILTRYTAHLEILYVDLRPPGPDEEHIRTCIQQAHPLFHYIEWFYPRCSKGRTIITISSKTQYRWKIS